MAKPVRSEKLTVRFREHQLALLKASAEARGQYVAEFVRDCAVREAARELGSPSSTEMAERRVAVG